MVSKIIWVSAILILGIIIALYYLRKFIRYTKEQLDTGGAGYLGMRMKLLSHERNKQRWPHYKYIIHGPTTMCENCHIQVATQVRMGKNRCVQC